jgi:hypothetical protein
MAPSKALNRHKTTFFRMKIPSADQIVPKTGCKVFYTVGTGAFGSLLRNEKYTI